MKKHEREALQVAKDTAEPYGVTVAYLHDRPGHPKIILTQGDRYIGTVTFCSTPRVPGVEGNYMRQDVRRKLKAAGF
ncbi:hypothetical protein [Caulobacter phage BL94]|nr:hypothetical protein [Caulobacter phage BL94]